MDKATIAYYSENAESISENYNRVDSGVKQFFPAAFIEGMRILDIGCGSGRDMNYLYTQGFDVYGVDPSKEMLSKLRQSFPHLQNRVDEAALPDLKMTFSGKFDGVLCSATLMHLSSEELFDSAFAIKKILKDNGVLLLSIPDNRPGIDKHYRDNKGRLFNQIQPEYLRLLFERLGFVVTACWKSDDALHREGYSWFTIGFRLRNSAVLRPIDIVESVLTRDRKTATYKLALIRALSEIALTEYKIAKWLPNGKVEIPVSTIAEKWLFYYWSLFESYSFIPQTRGEEIICSKPVAFRSAFNELIDRYRKTGGLNQFAIDQKSGRLNHENGRIARALLKKIQNTIISGPIKYSGGSLEEKIFQYNPRTQSIIIHADLWIELSLMGYWIRDAVILRWADMTCEISKHTIQPGDIINMLLVKPTQERDVLDARRVYEGISEKECVWTGNDLGRQFDVDHIIPFSLWRNNDLWNLMPVLRVINRQKRDRLPTRSLLIARKNSMILYWERLRERHMRRFDTEATKIAGLASLQGNWQDALFGCIVEATEITAMQTGCERWEP